MVPGKPVYVKGFDGLHEYLGHLVSESGDTLGMTMYGSIAGVRSVREERM